jgi:hypothetical protein
VQAIVKAEGKIDRPLRVLMVEDHKSDVVLLLAVLRFGGFDRFARQSSAGIG